VGDIIKYGNTRYTVLNIKLQKINLSRGDGAYVIIPTEQLRTAMIHNVSRYVPLSWRLLHQGALQQRQGQPACACKCTWCNSQACHAWLCRSSNLWQSLEVTVDMDCKQAALERVATEVMATIKLHPRWFGGSYRVWFADACLGWKLKIGIYFDYSDRGAAPCPCGAPAYLLLCMQTSCIPDCKVVLLPAQSSCRAHVLLARCARC
jgi:Mechanosensitive ion channel